MDKRKGYVLLLINAGVRNSVSERKKSRRLFHYVQWNPVITLVGKRAFRVLLLELVLQYRTEFHKVRQCSLLSQPDCPTFG